MSTAKRSVRCAVYTRKSSEEGLDQQFNSLDAQRESGEAYIASMKHEGWLSLPDRYDDGGYTGGNMDRPGLKRLLADIAAGKIDCVVVYKVDRLSRSLIDFSKIMESFESKGVSFVSVTQSFNTTHSMGRLTLNILLSFAQFERELCSERTRDKIAAARRKGKWMGGRPVLGYDLDFKAGRLSVNQAEAKRVREIFTIYAKKRSLMDTLREVESRGWKTKAWTTGKGRAMGDQTIDKGRLYSMLTNPIYLGQVRYRTELHPGEHEAIVDQKLWGRVQEALRANGRDGGSSSRNKHGALLKGILSCGPCRCAMWHTYAVKGGTRAYRYYTCHAALKQGRDKCPAPSIPADTIEKFVVDRIRAVGRDPSVLATTLETLRDKSRERRSAIERRREADLEEQSRVQAEIRRVTAKASGNARAAGALASLNDQLRAIEARLIDLSVAAKDEDEHAEARETLQAALSRFDELWAELSPREQARVVRLLVKHVRYDGKAGSVTVTFHDGVPGVLLEAKEIAA